MRHPLCNTLATSQFGRERGRSHGRRLSLKGAREGEEPQTHSPSLTQRKVPATVTTEDNMKVAVCLLVSLPLILAESGMAELKAVTGDEPYNGFGNAPAPMPRPMGFWGRPRMSPMGYGGSYGGSPYGPGMGGMGGMGGGFGYGSPMDRFSSFSHSPYEEVGPTSQFNRPQPSLMGLFNSFIDGAGSPFDDLLSDSPRRGGPSSFNNPRGGSSPFSARGANTAMTGPRPDFPRSLPAGGSQFQSGPSDLSSFINGGSGSGSSSGGSGMGAGLGGFYKGKGN